MDNSNDHLTFHLSNPKILGSRLSDLWLRHSDWVMARSRAETVYCLPVKAIKELAFDATKTGRLFDKAQAAAELEFTALCTDFFAVGVHHGQFITGTPLNPRPGPPDPDLLKSMKQLQWTDADIRSVTRALAKAGTAADRVKGYVGWLLTEPMFLSEVGELRAAWDGLADRLRPAFPLRRPYRDLAASDGPGGGRSIGSPAQEFGARLVAFLDKWALTSLATWDLPVPQGPLLPNLLPANSPAAPQHGIHLFLPAYYPLHGDDDLLRRVLEFQLQLVRRLGIDASAAGLPHHEAYARLVDVLHLERAIRSRFPDRSPPRSLVGRIISAAVKCFRLSEDQTRKYRKAISRCLKGQRDSVPMMRVRPSARRGG